jgi:hypothetical protein
MMGGQCQLFKVPNVRAGVTHLTVRHQVCCRARFLDSVSACAAKYIISKLCATQTQCHVNILIVS